MGEIDREYAGRLANHTELYTRMAWMNMLNKSWHETGLSFLNLLRSDSICPEINSPAVSSKNKRKMPWYALYTRSRNEKKVADLLERKGVEIYCPLQEEVRQWSDRKKKVKLPVFRSYVFVRLESYADESVAVLETPGAVRFLWWLGKPAVVREEEIIAIRQFLREYAGAPLSIEYREGEKVSITAGPLKEQEGTLLKIQGNKAILYIHSLGIRLKAELPLNALKPVR